MISIQITRVIGTDTTIEKDYFRLTSEPNPLEVRTLSTLQKVFDYNKNPNNKYNNNLNKHKNTNKANSWKPSQHKNNYKYKNKNNSDKKHYKVKNNYNKPYIWI